MSLLAYPFMQHAILAALLCSVACGVIGSLVVLNRLSYLAGAIAHAAYGGIGIAFICGLPAIVCAMGFSLASSMIMATILLHSEDAGSTADTAMGILWAGGMAFGIILIELSPGYAGDLLGFLFGSILAVPLENIYAMTVLDILLLLLFIRYRQGLTAITIDPEFARSRGLPVHGLFHLLVGMAAVAVVMLLQVVGLILVIALLTIPPHMARHMTRSLPGMMAVASALCFLFCLIGLALAYVWDLSSGALIIAVAVLAYGAQTFWLRTKN